MMGVSYVKEGSNNWGVYDRDGQEREGVGLYWFGMN
jgi:hypothetical protein